MKEVKYHLKSTITVGLHQPQSHARGWLIKCSHFNQKKNGTMEITYFMETYYYYYFKSNLLLAQPNML